MFDRGWAFRDTSVIGAGILSKYRIFVRSTGAAKAIQFVTKAVIYHGAVF